MGRAERRRLEKQRGKQVKTYNLTRSQLHNAVRQVTAEDLKRIKQEAMEDAINTAMTLLLVLPMEVLMDHYWKKTYAKKIPEFTELVLQYYERWQNGELDMDEMKKDLWEYGGVVKVCKLSPPSGACRMCVDTWESFSGQVDQMPDCNTCTYNTEEYEVLEFVSSLLGSYALVSCKGKVQRVSISRIKDLREI